MTDQPNGSHCVLVIEDDENLRVALIDNLESEGHRVLAASTLKEARRALRIESVDLLLLDLMLPDGDGYGLCRELRAAGDATPVLMLTARSLEEDLVRGFEAGADDYVTKPYRLRELLVRVQALLRRRSPIVADRIQFGAFQLDRSRRGVFDAAGSEVQLTPTEFDLLAFLLEERGSALTRKRILGRVWGAGVIVDGRTVDNFVSNLKRKLAWDEGSGFRIKTVRGVGYRMEIDPDGELPGRLAPKH